MSHGMLCVCLLYFFFLKKKKAKGYRVGFVGLESCKKDSNKSI